jgi:hypothetical protein
MPKKSYLKGGDVALGSMDDAFYVAESWNKKMGQRIGKELGMTPKQIKKKNLLLKNVRALASKGHFTHSPTQRHRRYLREFKGRGILDTKLKRIRKISQKYPQS